MSWFGDRRSVVVASASVLLVLGSIQAATAANCNCEPPTRKTGVQGYRRITLATPGDWQPIDVDTMRNAIGGWDAILTAVSINSTLDFDPNGSGGDIRIVLDPSLPSTIGAEDLTNGLSFGEVRINPIYKASTIGVVQEFFYDILSHEFGHVVGFGHQESPSCTNTDTIMKATMAFNSTSSAVTCADERAADRKYRGDESPVVIPIGEKRPDFTALQEGVYFNLTGGCAEPVSWPRTDQSGWLALDLDGDGSISSGLELFGNFTLLPSGERAAHGYEALEQYDANHDGVLSGADPVFSKLAVWTDTMRDGQTEASELHGLRDLGIMAIGLNATELRRHDAEGNWFRYRAPLWWRDGHRTWSWDVFVLHAGCIDPAR